MLFKIRRLRKKLEIEFFCVLVLLSINKFDVFRTRVSTQKLLNNQVAYISCVFVPSESFLNTLKKKTRILLIPV